ncbi:chromatin remodelling complex Rsc7/Swp82 subunit-domain-containing protein [Schizophyllum amplum]|uniref:Chromatin remodelling complex Rsc7/Swp82 subunit-domain-containing protein n=1 Tax=Schizophyllum amplum TaxID=97359 RepID=A0A550CQD9_9AGAR|nr:chromatin remodelling complex Rsc7/Swp82 subunit-domain-containing protein [Auriculariopsis ampla]
MPTPGIDSPGYFGGAEEIGDGGDPDGDTASVPGDGYDDAPTPAKRARGRPRGRPRSSGASSGRGTPRPRGRPPGRGKKGGRGRGVTFQSRDSDVEGDDPLDAWQDATTLPSLKVGGQAYTIDGDEFITEDDPAGETKIDKNGVLLGGRQFKATTFTIPNRHPSRMYMLAIDAARTSGFRDSLTYFRRNPLAHKLNATQAEKDYLISAGKLGNHLKTRSVTFVTARSAYKLHGARTIVGGRWVVDDYYEARAKAEAAEKGAKPGDPVADPNPPAPAAHLDEAGGLALTSASHPNQTSSGGIYKTGGPTTIFGSAGLGPFSDGPLNAVRKSLLTRDGATEENWMALAAARTRAMDDEWKKWRTENVRPVVPPDSVDFLREWTSPEARREPSPPRAVYEPHTGAWLLRSDTQPTRARWETLPDNAERTVIGGSRAGNRAWGVAWVETTMDYRPDDIVREQEERESISRGVASVS